MDIQSILQPQESQTLPVLPASTYGSTTQAWRLNAIAHALQVSPGKLMALYDGAEADTEQLFSAVYRVISGELPPDKAGVVSHRILQELGGAYIF